MRCFVTAKVLMIGLVLLSGCLVSSETGNDNSEPIENENANNSVNENENENSSTDACEALEGKSFRSVELLNCGLGPPDAPEPLCHWPISFAEGQFEWMYTDIAESGTYTCQGLEVLGLGAGDRDLVGSYDSQTGILTWDGVQYEEEEPENEQVLKFNGTGAEGFCPQPDEIFQAIITRQEDGSFLFTGTVLLEGDAEIDDCLQGLDVSEDCLVETELDQVTLTTEQAEELEVLLESVPEKECQTPKACAVDPCLIDVYEFNNRREEAFCCGALNEGFQQGLQNIKAFLEELAGMADPGEGGEIIFSMQREGFCSFGVAFGEVWSAEITYDLETGYVLSGTALAEGDPSTDECLEDFHSEAECVIEIALEAVVLTDDQVEQLESLLAAVPEKNCQPIEGLYCAPPCATQVFEFNGRAVSPGCCGTLNEGFAESLQNIDEFISELLAQ